VTYEYYVAAQNCPQDTSRLGPFHAVIGHLPGCLQWGRSGAARVTFPEDVAWSAGERPSVAARAGRQGRVRASHQAAATRMTAQSVQPRAVVPSPAY